MIRLDENLLLPLQIPRTLPASLLQILIDELALSIDSLTDVFHVSSLFHEWWSQCPMDRLFGGKAGFFRQSGSGRNIFVNCPAMDNVPGIIEKIVKDLRLQVPTRAVLVISHDCVAYRKAEQISLFLAANKESILRDPILWSRLCQRLKKCLSNRIDFPSSTDNLFRERAPYPCNHRGEESHP